jgi:hypothetical protein
MLKTTTITMSIKAAPHPCEWADSSGCEANPHILRGNASIGLTKLVKNKLVPRIVIIEGAVSPAILDMDNIIPVRTPLLARFKTINNVTFQF